MQRIGDSGEIQELQRLLRLASKLCRRLPCPEADGIYGSLTRASVIIFQQCSGLPVTGEADAATLKRLELAAAAAEEYYSPPAAVSPFCRETVLSLGSSGAVVRILQIMLLYLAERYDNIPFPENSGIYGPLTSEAVAAVQRAWRIFPNGNTDIFTWNRIVRLFNLHMTVTEK